DFAAAKRSTNSDSDTTRLGLSARILVSAARRSLRLTRPTPISLGIATRSLLPLQRRLHQGQIFRFVHVDAHLRVRRFDADAAKSDDAGDTLFNLGKRKLVRQELDDKDEAQHPAELPRLL